MTDYRSPKQQRADIEAKKTFSPKAQLVRSQVNLANSMLHNVQLRRSSRHAYLNGESIFSNTSLDKIRKANPVAGKSGFYQLEGRSGQKADVVTRKERLNRFYSGFPTKQSNLLHQGERVMKNGATLDSSASQHADAGGTVSMQLIQVTRNGKTFTQMHKVRTA
jgi:hypothetical protein